MKSRKCIAIIMVIAIFTAIAIPDIIVANMGTVAHTKYDNCDITEFYTQDKEIFTTIQSQLPPGTPPTAKGYPFNYRLWHDKHVIVYGSYKSINNSINTFKGGTQDEQGNKSAGGYYIGAENGLTGPGEYRYHGFDVNGNKYTNINFINDFKITDPLEKNKWLFRPWNNNLIIKDRPIISNFNKSAYEGDLKTQEWISDTAREFEIKNGLNITGQLASSVENSQKYNFISVLTPPTATHPGEGRMWHQAVEGVRYQTFSIKQLKKNPTPVVLKMELLTPSTSLNILDTGNTKVQDAVIPVKIRLTATLQDTQYYQDEVERTNYYTRYDIAGWTLKLNKPGAGEELLTGVSFKDNVATIEKTVNYTLAEIRSKSFQDTLYGTAYATFVDKTNSNPAPANVSVTFNGIQPKPIPPPPPVMVELKPDIPPRWYDIVEFPASDGTDLTDISKREVSINGNPINAEQFFTGNYIFGEDKLGLNEIEMKWYTKDNQELSAILYTVIYPTKPNAEYRLSGNFIENRKMSVVDNSANSNLDFVISRYPITDYEWTFKELDGSGNLKLKDLSTTAKDFLCKKPGTYQIELIVTNSLGRKSDPYIVTFIIFPDYPAAVICNLNNSVLARNESISAYAYDAVSTDGDTIASNTLELWYDSNNDGECEQLLKTWSNITSFPGYTPDKLGKYKFVNKVTEEFGHPTIPEFVTAADRKSITIEREFWVDNYIPMTGLYIDIPITRPEIDVFFMIDQNVKKTSLDWIINNRMNINNSLRMSNVIAKVENWDLKTYEYTQPASTTRNTGSSYPSGSVSYSSNGYNGTLSRISVSDNGSYYDFGSWQTRTLTKTASDTASGYGWTSYDKDGKMTGSGGSSTPSISYSDGEGYSGTLSKTGYSQVGESTSYNSDGSYTVSRDYIGYYSGTVRKTETYWVPNMQWVSDYTGYYSGTIYKYMIQPYAAPFVTTHKKYVIYVTDGSIENTSEFNMVRNNNAADLILIGTAAAKAQTGSSHFILNDGSSMENLVNQALKWIADQNPLPLEELLTLQNKTFNISESNYDEENDPIINNQYQYVQDKDYYDNPTGQETGSQTSYSDTEGWSSIKKDKFSNVGLYTIYHRIQDLPTTNPQFANYSYYSNVPFFRVAVHRIPIAIADMAWKYDGASNLYKLTFVDRSYDLDHQFSRADKGIIDTQIRYRKDAGEWNYKMPTDLTWGSYTIEYYVMDVEQAWSNPYTMNINLAQVPPANITIESTTVQKDPNMRNDATIPAAEILQLTAPDKLQGPIIHSNVAISSAEVLVDGSKIGNLILTPMESQTEYLYHANIYDYTVPASRADGSFTISIKANTNIGNQSAQKNHSVSVYTPIWENYTTGKLSYIQSAISGVPVTMELSLTTTHDKLNKFKVVTSKYVSKLEISIDKVKYYLFKNGTLSTNINGSGAGSILTVDNTTSKYKVSNANINTTADIREWNFSMSVVDNYPLKLNQPYTMAITGYDEAGNAATTSNKHGYNPQIKTITPNNYLLYNLRVVMVRDLHLENYYKNPTAMLGQSLYIDKPMFVSSMAVDAANFGGLVDGLTKGYQFEFEIDSKNFNSSSDTIVLQPRFYTGDAFTRDGAERDLYWEDSNHQIFKAGEGGHSAWNSITLTASDRTIKEGVEATWRGAYLIPGTSWAVPKGTSKIEAKSRDLKRDIIVSFDIRGYKNGVLQFYYNDEQWAKERTSAKYPYLIGDVIKYSWKKNCLDDIKIKDNR